MNPTTDAKKDENWRTMLARSEAAVRPRRSLSPAIVLETIVELQAAGRVACRATIAEMLNVPVVKIDEHTKRLFEDGLVRRLMPGVYEPIKPIPQARAVSMTKLVDGMTKLEIGDACLDLTPHECRAIASMLLGAAFDSHLLNGSRDLADQIAELRKKHFRMRDELRERAVTGALPAQAVGTGPAARAEPVEEG